MQLVATAADRPAAQAREEQVKAAWIKWYAEAMREIASLPAGPVSVGVKREIEAAVAMLQRW